MENFEILFIHFQEKRKTYFTKKPSYRYTNYLSLSEPKMTVLNKEKYLSFIILYYCLELYVTKIIVFLHKRVVIELLARRHLMQMPKRCSVKRLIFLNLK